MLNTGTVDCLQGIFRTRQELDSYEQMWHTCVYQPSWNELKEKVCVSVSWFVELQMWPVSQYAKCLNVEIVNIMIIYSSLPSILTSGWTNSSLKSGQEKPFYVQHCVWMHEWCYVDSHSADICNCLTHTFPLWKTSPTASWTVVIFRAIPREGTYTYWHDLHRSGLGSRLVDCFCLILWNSTSGCTQALVSHGPH